MSYRWLKPAFAELRSGERFDANVTSFQIARTTSSWVLRLSALPFLGFSVQITGVLNKTGLYGLRKYLHANAKTQWHISSGPPRVWYGSTRVVRQRGIRCTSLIRAKRTRHVDAAVCASQQNAHRLALVFLLRTRSIWAWPRTQQMGWDQDKSVSAVHQMRTYRLRQR